MKSLFPSLIKNKKFLKIWGVSLFSVVTANLINFVLMGRIYEQTGSSIAIGLLWAFYVVPTVILGPFSGVILDFINKKKILFWSCFCQAIVALFYIGVGQKMWLVFSILLLYSFLDEFTTPAIAVLLPSVVKKKELAAANSLFMFTTNGSIILGFLTGGLMLKFLGFSPWLFLTASALLLLGALLSSSLEWKEPEKKEKMKINFRQLYLDLAEGYRFIKKETLVLFPMILLAGLQVVIGMGLILMPAFAKSILKIAFADSSYFVLVPAVGGALLGSVIVERILSKNLKRVLVFNGLKILGSSILFTGLFLGFLPFKVAFGGVLAVLMGVAYVMMFIPLQMLVQENTPFPVRGRVFGTLNTLITIAAAIPVLATTTLVDILGVRLVFTLAGLGLLSLAFWARKGKYGRLLANHRA